MRLDYLWRGTPGHPVHPPLTDATIGIYTFATVAALLSALGIAEDAAAQAWWIALIVGLVTSAATSLTGILDWFRIAGGTPLKRTATAHWIVIVLATVLFAAAAIFGHGSYEEAVVETLPFVLTLVAFAALTAGGWLGGTIVFVHGMRVLNLVEEPTRHAASPVPRPEEEEAAKG